MKDIKAFIQNKKDYIEFKGTDVESVFKEKSGRCVEIPWVILQFLKNRNIKKILDLGISFFDRRYFNVFFEKVIAPSSEFHAVDIIPFNSKRFSRYVSADLLREKIKFKRADIRHMPYPDNFFDLIFCISTIEHVGFDKINLTDKKSSFDRSDELSMVLPSIKLWNEDSNAIKEIIRVLRLGGKLLLTVPFGKEEIIAEKDSMGLYAYELRYNEKRLDELMNFSGVKVVEKRIFVYDDVDGWTDKTWPIVITPRCAVACLEIEKV